MKIRSRIGLVLLAGILLQGQLRAGPYSQGSNDPTNQNDAPVPGFIGPDGAGGAPYEVSAGVFINTRNFVNPLFFDWADTVADYSPAPGVGGDYSHPEFALKSVTGDNFDVVSLGDLTSQQIAAGTAPGSLTLYFPNPIRNLTGADFTVFENALFSGGDADGSGAGGVFAELAYVEVSADGINFVRFPSRSLTSAATGPYGALDPSNVFNLAGKHVNAFGDCWSTPFDLAAVGLSSIHYIRLVDIPGSGAFRDSANAPIYDPWLTFNSGGMDVEAVGAISRAVTFDQWQDLMGLADADRGPAADPNRNGIPNLLEYAFSHPPLRPDDGLAQPRAGISANRLTITFTRDERATDLIYEVQASATLGANSWTTFARSTGGIATVGVNGYTPNIVETSASSIASVGVIRKVTVSDVQPITGQSARFLRVKISQGPVP